MMAPKHDISSFFRTVLHRPPPVIKPRNIKPRDVRKPSIAILNHDVVTLVIRCLYDTDPESLGDLALVCSALYIWARYVQHQKTYINLTRHHAIERLHSLSRNGFLPAVRELRVKVADTVEPSVDTIRDPPPKSRKERKRQQRQKQQLDAWNLLCNLVPQMPGLSHLHWIGAIIPDPVLEYLGKHTQRRLYITLDHRTEDPSGAERHREQLTLLDNLAGAMSRSQNFSSLRIKLENNSAAYSGELIHGPLKQLLLSSPALRSLSIDIFERQGGCVTQIVEPENCSFGLAGGEAPRNPLQELELLGYAWGIARSPPALAGMEYWQRAFDWSQLRRLVLHNRYEIQYRSIKLAEFLAPYLVALEEIELGGDYDQDDPWVISSFFNHLPSHKLTSITLPFLVPPSSMDGFGAHATPPLPVPPSFMATLTDYADTLRSLTIYPFPLTPKEVTFVRDSFRNLSTFTLVCDRDNATESWPHETFSLLVSIPLLQRLTIWFEIGPRDAPFKPYLNISSAGEVFSHLRQHGAAKLEQLTLHSGFPPRPLKGFLGPCDDWRWEIPSGFVCKSTQDIHGNSSYQVSCTKLSRAQNERLRRDAAASRGGTVNGDSIAIKDERDRNSIRYQIALTGPMALEEWEAWRKAWWDRIQAQRGGCRIF